MENQSNTKFCTQCNAIVETEIIFHYYVEERHVEELQGGGILINLSKCLRCQNPFLTEIDFNYVEDYTWEESNIQLYPNTENEIIKNCPSIIINPYREARKCYQVHAYESCVIMCRKGIEAICIDKGEEEGNLSKKLNNLKEKGILEGIFFQWANTLRLIGNEGAHKHEQLITQLDAKDALDFFDALITYFYHLVSQYDELLNRRRR